jgi:hypothetical protein
VALPDVDPSELLPRVITTLRAFLDPLCGGEQQTGWPFGRNVFISEIYQLLDQLPGVDYVTEVTLASNDSARLIHNAQGKQIGLTVKPHELVSARTLAADGRSRSRREIRWRSAPEQSSSYLQHLPAIFSEDPLLGRFLLAFEQVLTGLAWQRGRARPGAGRDHRCHPAAFRSARDATRISRLAGRLGRARPARRLARRPAEAIPRQRRPALSAPWHEAESDRAAEDLYRSGSGNLGRREHHLPDRRPFHARRRYPDQRQRAALLPGERSPSPIPIRPPCSARTRSSGP